VLAARPNPFRGSTTLQFRIPEAGRVEAAIHDVRGRRVITLLEEFLPAGPHSATWRGTLAHGEEAPAGLYFFMLRTAEGTSSRKLLLLR
jgi:flagellar hook assembly protein FlgD